MYEYRCKIVRVVDGDTVDVDIDLGFNTWIHNERVRLEGVDTPECRTTDLVEKFFGNLAKSHVERLLPVNSYQILQTTTCSSNEKYGRTLGFFKMNSSSVNKWLIENCYAVAYQGQNKDEIVVRHKENYKNILNNNGLLSILLSEANVTEDEVTQYLAT